jgi:hypothetical protein
MNQPERLIGRRLTQKNRSIQTGKARKREESIPQANKRRPHLASPKPAGLQGSVPGRLSSRLATNDAGGSEEGHFVSFALSASLADFPQV